MEDTGIPPIADPLVTIGNRSYSVVFSLRAEFKLSEAGVRLGDALSLITFDKEHPDPKATYYLFQLWAACVAHNYRRGEVAPTAEEWTDILGEDFDTLGLMSSAVGQAIAKRALARAKKSGTPLPAQIPVPSATAVN